MPFKSKQQMKACFASKGFHGQIDCDEWAKDTNYKSLPNKKQYGGSSMYRKKCKKCGGKMQMGGPLPVPGPTGPLPASPVNRRPQTLEEANAYAKNLAIRTGLVSGENTHVGNTLPTYRDEQGNILPDTWSPIPNSQVKNYIPSGVTELQWSSEANLPYYTDPNSGDMVYTSRDNFYLPRFQQNRGKSADQLGVAGRATTPVPPTTVAMRMYGGRLQRMQMGGPLGPYTTADDQLADGFNAPIDPDWVTPKPALNPVEDAIAKGLIDAPKGYDTPQQWYAAMQQTQPQPPPPRMRGNLLQNIGIGMMRGSNILSEISGRVERGRQNRYDYQQQSALGMQQPVPSGDFQPTPYSLYAKYGGSLKKYQQGGMPNPYQMYWDRARSLPNPIPQYPSSHYATHTPYSKADSAYFKWHFDEGMNNPFSSMDKVANIDAAEANYMIKNDPSKYDKEFLNFMDMQADALRQGANNTGARGASMLMNRPYNRPSMKKGGIHIKPENKGKFTSYCGGKVTDECIQRGLHSDSAVIRKRAQFAKNSRSWSK